MKLTNKIALITGGTSGLGLATAKRFVAEGAFVFITGRRQVELDSAVEEIGENTIGIRGDISKLSDLDDLFSVIKEKKGRLDILFANAGGGAFFPLQEVTEGNTSTNILASTLRERSLPSKKHCRSCQQAPLS